MKNLFFSLAFVIGVSTFSHAQNIISFSSDSKKYLDELTMFFDNVGKEEKKDAQEFVLSFTTFWNSGKLSDSRKIWVYKISNQMLKKKMKPIPHFKNYLTSVMNFNASNQPDDCYNSWHKGVEILCAKPNVGNYLNFIESTNQLLLQNILFDNKITKWTASNNNFTYFFDSVPKIIFNLCDLSCATAQGSHIIYGVKGTFYPLENKFLASSGKVTWKTAGFADNMVYAELSNYLINLRANEYTADSVNFYHKTYFTQPLKGKLTNRALPEMASEKVSYPRFESYTKRFKVNNIFENVDFDGGLTMNGNRLLGSGNDVEEAMLIFKLNGKKFVTIKSKMFVIQKDKISSDIVSTNIYYDKDSIFHPALVMRYSDPDKELSLVRDEKTLSRSPFFDTYHKVDMYFEELNWKMDQPVIDIKMLLNFGGKSKALFESSNFFSDQRYRDIQGMDQVNPLEGIYSYAITNKTRSFNLKDLSKSMRVAADQLSTTLIQLGWAGYIVYDPDKGKGTINERLMNYVAARYGKIDYDVIQFRSETASDKNNATLNLLNFDLKIKGVDMVKISDSQSVYIRPYEKELTLKKNRDFAFNGTIKSGLFDFYGNDFYFDYAKFKIFLNNSDSMSMSVIDKTKEPDEYGRYPMKRVRTVLEKINGELLIDDPNNKSGLKNYAAYPIFNSNNESFVYYDREFIHRGVYKKENFYFQIKPFSIDSLDKASTDNIAFNGIFHSGGIFPDFKENLKVQPDLSLGFVRPTPLEGFPLYKNKGKYFNIINLSYKGLRGDGVVNYITSTSKARDFYFFPDSMNAEVQSYEIQEQIAGVEYPSVKSTDVYVHWRPYKDIMTVTKRKVAFDFYNGKSLFSGKIFLTPKELTGNGYMEFYESELSSNLFKFKQHIFDADTADFKLKALNSEGLAFSTDNYKSHIDFEKMKGEFKANAGVSKIDFPINQYISYMDEFDWFIDKKEIELANTKSQDLAKLDKLNLKQLADHDFSGSEFISTRPGQDSLRFFCAKAKYSLNDNIIHAMNVKIIKVGDAAIYPDKGDVTVYKRAEMESFENAQILANTTTKFHTFYNASVNIAGRKQYTARGKYDYVDEKGLKQVLYFDKINLDTALQTVATGRISTTANFTLSPAYDYTGFIKLYANKEFINFNGDFRIKNNCEALSKSWVHFDSEIDPKNIYIPISAQPKDSTGAPIAAAIMVSNDSTQVYSAFLSTKNHKNDFEIISSNGFLFYDNITKEYRISNMEKLKQFSLPGNYLSLTTTSCKVYGEGRLDFGTRLGTIQSYIFGNVRNYSNEGNTEFDIIASYDFFFNEDALRLMSDKIFKNYKLEAVSFSRENYTKMLYDLIGVESADKLISDLTLYGEFKKTPKELIHNIMFTDLKLKWNPETRSYISEGKIGIGGIGKNQINKYVTGYFELIRKRGGDVLNFYLEPEEGEWYFFNYQNNLLQAISSDTEFNNYIANTKPENKIQKVEKGETPLTYTLATERKKKDFVKKFKTEVE